ncbi:hypothetical protein Tco_0403417 [Tanacetum coccineum]
MRTCPPRFFESAQRSFDVALRSSLERIVTASEPGFGDWQWRLATLPFSFGRLGVYSAGDVLNYAFLASRLQSAGLQTKLLWHTGIVASGPFFDDSLCEFNTSMETDLFSNSTCSRVFTRDIFGDLAVSCAGIIDRALDVCVDMTGSSPLTETGMADFVLGHAVIDVAQCKRVKYMAKCAAIGYKFLPFSFSFLGELKDDAVTLLKRI